MVDFKSAILFAIPSTIAVYFTRHYLLPPIPNTIIETDSFTLTKNMAIMIFFSIIMLIAAFRMIRDKQKMVMRILSHQAITFDHCPGTLCWNRHRNSWCRWWIFDYSGTGFTGWAHHEEGDRNFSGNYCDQFPDWFYG